MFDKAFLTIWRRKIDMWIKSGMLPDVPDAGQCTIEQLPYVDPQKDGPDLAMMPPSAN